MFYIRSISRIRKYLTLDAAKSLMHAYVTSRLDYANSLLLGVNKGLISKMQRVQNAAARVVTLTDRQSNSDVIIHSLHWLPIEKRIVFKVITILFKAKHNIAPGYLIELLPDFHNNSTYNLRSNELLMLSTLTRTTSSYWDKCFTIAAPKLWNCLPLHIKQCSELVGFKKLLKTHLFHL